MLVHDMPATILCIDDETVNLEAHKCVLETRGHKVFLASSGVAGLRIFETQKIDAVILDYWMSPMNGLAIAAQLKQLDPSVPIMMLSSFNPVLDEYVGLAETWILKGAEPEVLLEQLDQILQKHSKRGLKTPTSSLATPREPQPKPEAS